MKRFSKRPQQFRQKKQTKQKDQDESSMFFEDGQLEIDFRQTKFIGKRTGRYYLPEGKSQDGFVNIKVDQSDSDQSAGKQIRRLKKRFQIDQSDQKSSSSSETESNHKKQIKNNQRIPKRIFIPSNKNNANLQRQSRQRRQSGQSRQREQNSSDLEYSIHLSDSQSSISKQPPKISQNNQKGTAEKQRGKYKAEIQKLQSNIKQSERFSPHQSEKKQHNFDHRFIRSSFYGSKEQNRQNKKIDNLQNNGRFPQRRQTENQKYHKKSSKKQTSNQKREKSADNKKQSKQKKEYSKPNKKTNQSRPKQQKRQQVNQYKKQKQQKSKQPIKQSKEIIKNPARQKSRLTRRQSRQNRQQSRQDLQKSRQIQQKNRQLRQKQKKNRLKSNQLSQKSVSKSQASEQNFKNGKINREHNQKFQKVKNQRQVKRHGKHYNQKMQIYQQPFKDKQKKLSKSNKKKQQTQESSHPFKKLEISSIKKRSSQYFSQKNQTLKQFVDELNGGSNDELNDAVVQSQLFSNDIKQKDLKQSRFNKKKGNTKTFISNGASDKQSEQEKDRNKQIQIDAKPSQKLQKNKKNKFKAPPLQTSFLTQSLRKQSEPYYQKQRKQQQQRKMKQKQQYQENLRVKKRNRQFEIQTNDILDHAKLEEYKQREKKQKNQVLQGRTKPDKKFKTNEQQANLRKKQTKKYDADSLSTFLKPQLNNSSNGEVQYEVQNKQQVKQKQKQRILQNGRKIRQNDMKLKKRDRPQRIRPENVDIQSQKNERQRDRIEKQKQKMKKSKTVPQPATSQQQKEQIKPRKYPRRMRVPRLQYYKGEHLKYDVNQYIVNIQSKQLYRLIGFIEQTFRDNQITIQPTLVYHDRYVQQITIHKGQTMDFNGFDQNYKQLYIEAYKRRKQTEEKRKNVQVYQDGRLQDLRAPVVIQAGTGNFTIQNVGTESVVLELNLYKNLDQYLP